MQAYMVELYQDTLIDLLLPKNAKHLKLDIKKDSTVIPSLCCHYEFPLVNKIYFDYLEGFKGVYLDV